MYEISSISYWGGSCGDFLGLVIMATDPAVKKIIIKDSKISMKLQSGKYLDNVVEILKSGRVGWNRASSHIPLNKKMYSMWHEQFQGQGSVEKYIKKMDKMLKRDEYISNVLPKIWPFSHSVIVGHEHITLLGIRENIDDYYEWTDYIGSKKTTFITITTDKSLSLVKENARLKNQSRSQNWDFKTFDTFQNFTNKRPQDVELELEDIYDRDRLKNYVNMHYHKEINEDIFNELFDFYMSKQQVK